MKDGSSPQGLTDEYKEVLSLLPRGGVPPPLPPHHRADLEDRRLWPAVTGMTCISFFFPFLATFQNFFLAGTGGIPFLFFRKNLRPFLSLNNKPGATPFFSLRVAD